MTFTLVSDGSSDRALVPILMWAIRRQGFVGAINYQWADLRNLRNPPQGLAARILLSVHDYPCDLLFVHRDAEGSPPEQRVSEIANAVRSLPGDQLVVHVIPVRMMEAWLLCSPAAIRSAAGNPNGTAQLGIPDLRDVENLPDPKRLLHDLLREASELRAGRRRKSNVDKAIHRLADLIDDFSPLAQVPAFLHFTKGLEAAMKEYERRHPTGG